MGTIINGQYVKNAQGKVSVPNEQYKEYRHSMQRLDHRADVLQPRIGGKVNPDFVKAYPERAKDYFSKEDYEKGINE